MKRTKLTIEFPTSITQWNPENVELPVEVRRSDSALVGRTLATGSLNVGPGTYVARAVAQGGEFAGSVEVPPGQAEASVQMQFYAQSGSQHAGTGAASLENTTAKTTQALATLDLLAGHVLQGQPLAAAPLIQRDRNGLMRAATSSGSVVLRLKSHSGTSSLIASIPQSISAHVSWQDASHQGRPDVAFYLEHPQAQLLLSYLSRNAIADAQLAAHSATLTAAQLLRGKKWDPLAGALGAYVLLRQSDEATQLTAELYERGEQLCKFNSTFPDARCIWAECQARAGDYEKAFDTLLELERFGVPFFSDGLRIAGLRLAECLQPDALPGLEESRRARGTVLLRRLRWLGLHAVPGQPILKLTNFDPGDAQQYQEFWHLTAR